MYSSKAIANFFLDRGMDDDIEISPMKIIKLVYIAHGYHLAVTDVALIEDYVQGIGRLVLLSQNCIMNLRNTVICK